MNFRSLPKSNVVNMWTRGVKFHDVFAVWAKV